VYLPGVTSGSGYRHEPNQRAPHLGGVLNDPGAMVKSLSTRATAWTPTGNPPYILLPRRREDDRPTLPHQKPTRSRSGGASACAISGWDVM